jgi:diguanylate cyclase (GGDEF)-like protein/PAS domain S-box-containing protein
MRMRADAALRENQQNLRALFDTVEDYFFVLDDTGRILQTNAMARSHLGYTADELAGQDVLMVHPPDRRDEAAAIIAEMLAGKRDFCPVDLQGKDGTLTPVETRVTPGIWGGRPALFGVSRNITERKHAENELKRERALLAQAELIGHIGSWRVPLDGGASEWSGQAASILGLDPGSLGTESLDTLADVVHTDDREKYGEWVLNATESRRPCRCEFRILRPDGEAIWVCAHGALETSADGEPVAVAGILHDVTDRKQDEEARAYDLEEAANVDRLTGLHNLRGFDLVGEQVLAQAQRANQSIGLIFCDIDGLKEINDSFGHAQGDRALQDVSSILKFTLRSADAIARIGGDEFIVLSAGADRDSVARLNERLQEGFDFFNATNERPYRIEMSSGTSWSEPGAPCRLEELRMVADQAMYAEKLKRERGL